LFFEHKNSILEGFLKDVTLKTGVMTAASAMPSHVGINYILKYIQLENRSLKIVIIFQNITVLL